MILAKSLSRFSRNTLQCISYIRMLKDRGIIIRFEKEGLDTSRVTSEIFFTWTSAFAQGESESLSNNVKWGKRKGYSQGRFAFPYSSMLGYRKGEDGEPEIVPEEAEHIKMIFNLFLLGRSLRQIKEAFSGDLNVTPQAKAEDAGDPCNGDQDSGDHRSFCPGNLKGIHCKGYYHFQKSNALFRFD